MASQRCPLLISATAEWMLHLINHLMLPN